MKYLIMLGVVALLMLSTMVERLNAELLIPRLSDSLCAKRNETLPQARRGRARRETGAGGSDTHWVDRRRVRICA